MRKESMDLNKKIKVALVFAAFFYANFSFADDCEVMKSDATKLNKSSLHLKTSIAQIETAALNGNSCAKNIIGRFFYEGRIIEKDRNRAKAIFADLTNSGYAPSSFNLAFALSEDDAPNLELISNLLIGIYSTYITDKANSELASKARDFGYDYFASLKSEDGLKIKAQFEESIKFANLDGGATLRRQRAEMKQREEEIVSILMIGMAIKSASNMARASKAARSAPQFIQPTPMAPTLYHVTPLGGNMLYMMPLN
jgi:hypothetical protein